MEKISIVVPCYNEEEALPYFYKEIGIIQKQMENIEFEYIFINDGSKDQTLKVIKELHKIDSKVKYINFSRNFGKEAALYAGLKKASGDYMAVMDADLQDPPKLLIEMYKYIKEDGFDCVGTCRTTREGEPPIRSFFAHQFYKIINKISDTKIVEGARDFRLMNRQMVNAILSVTEYNRFSKGIFSWVGFETKYIEYHNEERVAGTTSWSFYDLLKYSVDGIVAYSDAPLSIAVWIGFISFFGALLSLFFIIIRTVIFGDQTSGWPSLVCTVLLIGGLQLLCIGILGKYIGKMFLETKKRPLYIIKNTNEDNL